MITPTGGALLLLGLYFLVARPHLLMPALVFFASFSGTSVFNTSSFGISPGVLFLALFLLWGVVSGRLGQPVVVDRNHPALALCLAAFAAYALGTLLLNGASGQRGEGLASLQLTQTIYLFVGVVVAVALSLELSRPQSLERAVRALRAGACCIAGWGILQAACFYGGVEYPAVVFNNSTSHFADMFDQRAGEGVIRIASVAVEPSFMASSLMIFGAFGATLVVCEPRFQTRGWLGAVLLTLGVVAASTSTTGFFGLAVLGLLLALRRPGAVLLAGLGALLLASVALLLLPGFRMAVYGVTLGKTGSTSFSDRTASFGHAMDLFAAQPWLGAGWGTDFSYSIATSLLANVGVVGTTLFAVALGGTLLASRSARHRACRGAYGGRAPVALTQIGEAWRLRAYALAAENAMLVYMAQAAASGFKYVVPDVWVLWALCLAIPSNLARANLARIRAGERAPAGPGAAPLEMQPEIQAHARGRGPLGALPAP